MEKICPACTCTFSCNDESDCWCESTHIHKKELVRLMSDWNQCLCPACLSEYEEN